MKRGWWRRRGRPSVEARAALQEAQAALAAVDARWERVRHVAATASELRQQRDELADAIAAALRERRSK